MEREGLASSVDQSHDRCLRRRRLPYDLSSFVVISAGGGGDGQAGDIAGCLRLLLSLRIASAWVGRSTAENRWTPRRLP
jgi:hypothetical protein